MPTSGDPFLAAAFLAAALAAFALAVDGARQFTREASTERVPLGVLVAVASLAGLALLAGALSALAWHELAPRL